MVRKNLWIGRFHHVSEEVIMMAGHLHVKTMVANKTPAIGHSKQYKQVHLSKVQDLYEP